jgi:hypothetical protein
MTDPTTMTDEEVGRALVAALFPGIAVDVEGAIAFGAKARALLCRPVVCEPLSEEDWKSLLDDWCAISPPFGGSPMQLAKAAAERQRAKARPALPVVVSEPLTGAEIADAIERAIFDNTEAKPRLLPKEAAARAVLRLLATRPAPPAPSTADVGWQVAAQNWKEAHDRIARDLASEKGRADRVSQERDELLGYLRRISEAAGVGHHDRETNVAIVCAKFSPPAPSAAVENVCEHGDHPAPAGKRFCSDACERCEHESKNEETGCDGICLKPAEAWLVAAAKLQAQAAWENHTAQDVIELITDLRAQLDAARAKLAGRR